MFAVQSTASLIGNPATCTSFRGLRLSLSDADCRVMLMVARDGIERQGGIDNTQVVDFAFCQKGEKGHSAGSAVPKLVQKFISNQTISSAPTRKYETSG